MNLKSYFFALASSIIPVLAGADTVLLDENFDEDYSKSFPYVLDADQLTPHQSIAALFRSGATGTTQPWWICKDNVDATDRFIASHSYYQPAGRSSDWLISMPLNITGVGFVLEFDAQCVNVRGTSRISDLSLFITDDLLNTGSLPETPTHVWHDIPYGDDVDSCEGDWTHYVYSLDEYASQTIYINFVNLNDDRDILCLDNVKVWRKEPLNLTAVYQPYMAGETAEVGVDVEVTDVDGIDQWSLQLMCDGAVLDSWSGDRLEAASLTSFLSHVPITPGETTHFDFVLSSASAPDIYTSGDVMGMYFVPTHRVFVEETTSLHCGNCPLGTYAIDCLLDDPDYGSQFLPVSVHIAALGFDPMAASPYYSMLPQNNAAPMVFVDRDVKPDGFNNADANYDPDNYYTFANRMIRRMQQHTPIDVDVDFDWVISGADTTAITCRATVKAAYELSDRDYRVAFVLTENNVGLDNNGYWLQENYSSGQNHPSRCGGWCDLPKAVPNVRYHDVARAISNYNGHQRSLPSHLLPEVEYTYEVNLKFPDTYSENKGVMIAPDIQRQMCQLTAIVIDGATNQVVNSARVSLSPAADVRYSIADVLANLGGISDITADSASDAEYFDVLGRRVAQPTSGIYISRSADGSSRIVRH